MGDNGSYSGGGGVGARVGACLYCALKDDMRDMALRCAEGGCGSFGGVVSLASQIAAKLWSGSASWTDAESEHGHDLRQSDQSAPRETIQRVSGAVCGGEGVVV